jgi:hypothetical protein
VVCINPDGAKSRVVRALLLWVLRIYCGEFFASYMAVYI